MGAIDDDKSLVVSCYTNYPEQNKTILCTHHPQPQLFHLPSCSWPSTILKNQKYIPLRGSPPKSVPLDFGLDKTFALYFYHQHYYPS